MRIGADYYPEHWEKERWKTDAEMMVKANIKVIRIGEFAWSLYEPEEGKYEFDWMDEALDFFGKYGIKVVMCTPSATPPKWMIDKYPDILQNDIHGNPKLFGTRKHYCFNSETYREKTKKLNTLIAKRYAKHPAIEAWQVDNELGWSNTTRCYCKSCENRFRSWLKEQIEIPKEHLDAFTSFCLDGNASIVHDYYESNYGQQVENVLLIAKATIYGLLDEVKYKDLHKEIGYAITPEQENTWKENITLVDGKVKTGEYTDFVSCMNIGVLPERTCMNYRDGAYNECLLSTFDANKKVIYVTEEDEIIGRAILRLTKLSDEGDKNLHFEDVAEDTPENKENLVVFLERCYKNGFSGKKAAMIYRKLYDLAKRKAELLGAGLVLADDYKTVAELNGLAKKCSYIYVSESKNGKQYLDSLGGNCESGGYYVRGNFFFAS